MNDKDNTPSQKDFWDKAKIVAGFTGLATPIVAVVITAFAGIWLEKVRTDYEKERNAREAFEANARFYTEIVSRREAADGLLRKDLFQHIIQPFLKDPSNQETLDSRMVALELLAQNFHDSVSLRPIFYDLDQQIRQLPQNDKRRGTYQARLYNLAADIVRKQMLILQAEANTKWFTVDLTRVANLGEPYSQLVTLKHDGKSEYVQLRSQDRCEGITRQDASQESKKSGEPQVSVASGPKKTAETLPTEEKKRRIRLDVLRKNYDTSELRVRLYVIDDREPEKAQMETAEFWVGFFDFPMLDNTRLKDDLRCAVWLQDFEEPSAKLSVVIFPAYQASIRDKPFLDELVAKINKRNE